MIIVTRPDITDEELDHIRERVEAAGLRTHLSRGEQRTIIGCIGDEARLQEVPLRSLPGRGARACRCSSRTSSPRASSSREPHRRPRRRERRRSAATRWRSSPGPARWRSATMLRRDRGRACSAAGATMLRGGAFKPRTSPYAFQGLGERRSSMLAEVRARDRAARRHRGDGHARGGAGGRARRRAADRRAQHAELRAALRGRAACSGRCCSSAGSRPRSRSC